MERTALPISSLDQRRFKEGRGQGDKSCYLPWILNHDEASSGFSTRIHGTVTEREHHFQQESHTDYFRILDTCPEMWDIKESFPLPLQETLKIAKTLKIPHPSHSTPPAYRVITTDFLVTVKNGPTLRHLARCYVKSSSLGSYTTLQALEIQRRYWSLRNIDWGLVTENEVPAVLIANAKYLHASCRADWLNVDYDGTGINPLPQTVIHNITTLLTPQILEANVPLNVLTEKCDQALGLKPGISLRVATHLIIKRQWPADFRKPIHPWIPLGLRKL